MCSVTLPSSLCVSTHPDRLEPGWTTLPQPYTLALCPRPVGILCYTSRKPESPHWCHSVAPVHSQGPQAHDSQPLEGGVVGWSQGIVYKYQYCCIELFWLLL